MMNYIAREGQLSRWGKDGLPDAFACIKEESMEKLKEMRLDLGYLVGLHGAGDRHGRVVGPNRQIAEEPMK